MKHSFHIILLGLICCFTVGNVSSQKDPILEKYQRELKYGPENGYQGPSSELKSEPFSQNEKSIYSDENNKNEGITFSDDRINRNRERNLPNMRSRRRQGGNSPFSLEQDNIDLPETSSSTFSISPIFGKIFLITLISALVIWLLIMLIRSDWFKKKEYVSENEEEAWNPLTVELSELEKRLLDAKNQHDYRACVRIYFTFILRENIRLNRIHWKKEYTNTDYRFQLSGKKGYDEFSWIVRIFEQIWYGKTNISSDQFNELEPKLQAYYQQLVSTNEEK